MRTHLLDILMRSPVRASTLRGAAVLALGATVVFGAAAPSVIASVSGDGLRGDSLQVDGLHGDGLPGGVIRPRLTPSLIQGPQLPPPSFAAMHWPRFVELYSAYLSLPQAKRPVFVAWCVQCGVVDPVVLHAMAILHEWSLRAGFVPEGLTLPRV